MLNFDAFCRKYFVVRFTIECLNIKITVYDVV